MNYMLDTNILIYLIKNKPPGIADRINTLDKQDQLTMSFLTYAELLKSAEHSTGKDQVLMRLQQLTRSIPVNYSVNTELCQHYATQFALHKTAGMPIGANDLWIACHALAQNATLVTHNLREFEHIKGLRLENWLV